MNHLTEIQIEKKEYFGLIVSRLVVAEKVGKYHANVLAQIERFWDNENGYWTFSAWMYLK